MIKSHRHQKKNFSKNERAVVGLHAVRELFMVRPKSVAKLLLREDFKTSKEHEKIFELAKKNSVQVQLTSSQALDRLVPHQQGVIAYSYETPHIEFADLATREEATVIYLDGVTDPHNLGAILRTSWLMGVAAIVIPSDRSVGLSPAVHKVACGGAEHVPILKVVSFTQGIEFLKKSGYWVYGLDASSRQELYRLQMPSKLVLIVGAEEKGLRQTTKNLCDEMIKIPQLNNAASYNASVAMALVLGETFRQRSN